MNFKFLHIKMFMLVLSMISMSLFSKAADYYWVGGSGNWSDHNSHWATSSGGSTFYSQIPTQFDNVIFDANSFSTTGKVVTIDADVYCLNMDWSNATNNPNFSGSREMHIYGSMILNANMQYNASNTVFFEANTTGHSIKTFGKTLAEVKFNGQGTANGGWILNSDFNVSKKLDFYGGTFITNGYGVSCSTFYAWYSTNKVINFTGTDTIRVGSEWRLYPNGSLTTFTPGTSTIKFTGINMLYYYYMQFYGGNYTYNDIVVYRNGSSVNIDYDKYGIQFYGNNVIRDLKVSVNLQRQIILYDNSTYRDVTFSYLSTSISDPNPDATITGTNTFRDFKTLIPGTVTPNINIQNNNTFNLISLAPGTNLILANGRTQTVSNLVLNGTCSRKVNILSSSRGYTSTISMASGIVNADWITLRDITATGGASFNATNSLNKGNVSGWSISTLTANTYYWIGGSGNWNDASHWSTTSGGSSAACNVPTRLDNVVFDANSFSASGQAVSMNIDGECNNMTWTSLSYNPTFKGGQNLVILGSLKFASNMIFSHTGKYYFESINTGNTIDMAGFKIYQAFFGNISGTSGSWTMQSELKVNRDIYFYGGTLTTAGYNVYAHSFYANYSAYKNLNFTGTDKINLQSFWYYYNVAGSSLIMDTADIVIYSDPSYPYEYMYFYGGGQTYNDVTFTHTYPYGYYVYMYDNNTIRDLTVNFNGYQRFQLNGNSTFRNIVLNTTTGLSTSELPYFYIYGSNTATSLKTTNTSSLSPQVILYNSNTFATFQIAPGSVLFLGSGITQNVTNLILIGQCDKSIEVKSTSAGSAGKFSKLSGTVNADYLRIQDNIALGGATFNANHTIDNGNVTGWNVIANPATNYYWVGGTGNWNDPAHWSVSSGGAGGGCNVPTFQDNVFFDLNSFTAANQTVTVNVNSECRSMTWNGVTGTPRLSGNSDLKIFGSIILDPNMLVYYSGNLKFESTSAGNIIKTLNHYFSNVYFNGSNVSTGVWDLQSNLRMNSQLYHLYGTLNANGYDISCMYYYGQYGNIKTLNLNGSGTINCSYYWAMTSSSSTTFNPGNYTIKMDYPYYNYFYGGNRQYYDLSLNLSYTYGTGYISYISDNNTFNNLKVSIAGTQELYIQGSNTFNDVQFSFTNNNSAGNPKVTINGVNTFNDFSSTSTGTYGPYFYLTQNNTYSSLTFAGIGTRIFMGAGKTQTTGNFLALGSGGFPVFLQSTTAGTQATISQATGNVCLDFIWLKDVKAIGGATFNAGASSTDIGNNTGWSFTSCNAYYWVGGSGNWSDLNHWATSSGGSFLQTTLPDQNDNVFFDGNSFSATGQTVNVNVSTPECKNMSWLSSLYNPTLAGSSAQIDIYGSLNMIAGMNVTFTGDFNFKSSSTGEEVNTAAKAIQNANFSGSGEWTLKNVLNVNSKINLSNGSLLTNNKNINTKYFDITTSNTRALNLSSSIVTIDGGGWNIADKTNLTFTKGTSKIILTANSGSSNFFGNSLPYYNVTFTSPSTMSSSFKGTNSFNILRFEAGVTAIMETVTQTATKLEIEGNCSRYVTIESETSGTQAAFSQASGTINAKFVNLKDNNATGGATYNANLSNNNGNVTGWSFTNLPVMSVAIDTTFANCQTPNNGTAKVVITGGTSPFSYLWSTTETTDSIGGLIPGNYSVKVTDAYGCDISNTFTISTPPNFSLAVNTTDLNCYGDNNGSASLNLIGGTAPFTYLWSNTQTSASVTSLVAGNYTVTVNDANGCQQSGSFAINEPSQLSASYIDNTNICSSGNAGDVTLTATGGTPTYQYSLDNGSSYQSIANFTSLSAGTYSAMVKDANSCISSSISISISIPTTAFTLTATPTDAKCFSSCDGSVLLSATGGTAPYRFGGSGSGFSHEFTGTTFNTSIFTTITDPYYPTSVSQNNELVLSGGSSWSNFIYTNQSFTRNAGQTFEFKAKSDNSNTMIGWISSNPTQYYNELVHGFYIYSGTVEIYEKGNYITYLGNYGNNVYNTYKIELLATGAKYYINNNLVYTTYNYSDASMKLGLSQCCGNYFYTDSWKAGSGSGTTALCAGTYQYTVMDTNGCTASTSVTISQPQPLVLSINTTDVGCFGGNTGSASVSATGGTGSYSYSWSTGGSASSESNLTAGSYSVTATDSNGCIETANFNISEPSQLVASYIDSTDYCDTGNVGHLFLSASGGTPSYLYSIDNGSNFFSSSVFNSLTSGTYDVKVKDANNCVSSAVTAVLSVPSSLLAISIAPTGVSCFNSCDGSVLLSASGGTAPYSYSGGGTGFSYPFSGTSLNTSLFTTRNGSFVEGSGSLRANTTYNYNYTGYDNSIATTQTFARTTGNIFEASFSFDYNAYGTFGWTNGGTVNDYSSFTHGIYYNGGYDLYIVENGGTWAYVANITPGTYYDFKIELTSTGAKYYYKPSTSTTFTLLYTSVSYNMPASNAVGACYYQYYYYYYYYYYYSYGGFNTKNWKVGGGSQPTTDLCAGTYPYFVTDSKGCTSTDSATISSPAILTTSISNADTFCLNDPYASFTSTTTGGTAPFSYSWSFGNGDTSSSANPNYAYDTTGTYSVTLSITDANGCTTQANSSIVSYQCNLPPVAVCKNATIYVGNNCEATLSVSDVNNGSYDPDAGQTLTYSISTAGPFGIGQQNVILTVTDPFNETSSCTTTVTIQDSTKPTILTQNIIIQLNASGTASITASQIDNGSTDNCSIDNISVSPSSFDCSNVGNNTVTLTVTDVNGNSSTATATVTVEDNINPVFSSFPSDITVNAQPNDCNPIVTWTEPTASDNCSAALSSTFSSGDNFPVGTTQVIYTATDPSGNFVSDTFSVTIVPSTLLLTYSLSNYNGSNVSCFGSDNGYIDITVNGGCEPYTYIWSNSFTTEDVTGLIAGNYSVTVTDANDTQITQNFVIAEPQQLTSNIVSSTFAGGWNVSCFGASNGNANLTVIGGTAPFAYLWSNSATTEDLSSITAGSYSVILTDANGCKDSSTIVLTEPQQLSGTITSSTYVGGNNISCFGNSDGNADLAVTGGTSPYTYLWSNNASTEDLANLSAGTYQVSVTDANGCSISLSIQLTEPAKLVISAGADREICFNTATVLGDSPTAQGGISPYAYSWTPTSSLSVSSSSNPTAMPLSTTTYTLFVADANGCNANEDVTITVNPLPVASITASTANDFCNGVTLVASSSTTENLYDWSRGDTTQSIFLTLTNDASGVYTVTVTDSNGCISAASASYTYSPQSLASTYTIIGFDLVKLGENDEVVNGSVGVTETKGHAILGKNVKVSGANSFVKAAKITKHTTATATTITSKAVVTLPTMNFYDPASGSSYSSITVKKNTTRTISTNYASIKVEEGATAILTGNVFGEIEVESNAKVTFTSSLIDIDELKVESKRGKNNSVNTTFIYFSGDATVRVENEVEIEGDVVVNPDEYQVIFYIGSDPTKYSKGHNHSYSCHKSNYNHKSSSYKKGKLEVKDGGSVFNASAYIPEGEIKVEGVQCKNGKTYMNGFFIAEKIESNGKDVVWNWHDCSPIQNNPNPKMEADISAEDVTNEGNMHLKVYPNPFTDQAIVEFGTTITENVSVELYNILGDRLDVLFTGEVEEGISQQVNLSSASLSNGFYYVRMTKGTETIVQKVILNR